MTAPAVTPAAPPGSRGRKPKRGPVNDLGLLVKLLRYHGACGESLAWLSTLPAGTTPAEAYEACERGDWLLWIAGRSKVDRKALVLAACACAERALQYVPAWEERTRRAIEMARAWCEGKATLDEVRSARDAAADAAAAAYAAYAAYAYACAYAAYAAAYAADAATARAQARKEQAVLVRSVIPWSMLAEKLEVLRVR